MKTHLKFKGFDLTFLSDYYAQTLEKLESDFKKSKNLHQKIQLTEELYNHIYFLQDMIFFGYPEVRKGILDIQPENRRIETLYSYFLGQIKKDLKENQLVKIGQNIYIFHNKEFYIKLIDGNFYRVHDSELLLLNPEKVRKLSNQNLINTFNQIWNNYRKTPKYKRSFQFYLDYLKNSNWGSSSAVNFDSLLKTGIIHSQELHESVSKLLLDLKNQKSLFNADQLKNILVVNLTKHKISGKKSKIFLADFTLNSEKLSKIFYYSYNLAKILSQRKENIIYLFRDAITFYYAHQLIIQSQGQAKQSHYVLIGRKMLSSKSKLEELWYKTVDSIYTALQTCHNSYDKFLDIYYKHIKNKLESNLDFKNRAQKVYQYLKRNKILESKTIFIDTGLQASMPLFIKAIAKYLNGKEDIDFLLYVLGDWFKPIYGKKRFFSNYYPFMRDIEALNLGEYWYKYDKNSIHKNDIKIKMGSIEEQILSIFELLCLYNVVFFYERIQQNKSR